MTLKKHRESQDSGSENSGSEKNYIQVDNSPQCDPPMAHARTISHSTQQPVELLPMFDSVVLNNGPILTSNESRDHTESKSPNEA